MSWLFKNGQDSSLQHVANKQQKTLVNGKAKLTVISEGSVLEGILRSEGDIQIDGTIMGDVNCTEMSMGEQGLVEGNIIAQKVQVRGMVKGNVSADHVEVCKTGTVEGDIQHQTISIERKACVVGRLISDKKHIAYKDKKHIAHKKDGVEKKKMKRSASNTINVSTA